MTISVAIATFNRAAMVLQGVESALRQSCPPDEIVVADDASTDETCELLARATEREGRVQVIRQRVNTGGAANWNTAMDAAGGDLIAWCSDDDRFLPGHLQASADYLQAHPEIDMVHSSFVDVWETPLGRSAQARPLRSARPLRLDRRNLFGYLTRYYDWPFHPSTLVMRRRVWEQTGPFDPAFALADTDWFVRAAERFSIAMLPRYGVLNRRHAGNWSNRVGSARMQAEIFEIVEQAMLRRWPRGGPKRIFWRAVWRNNVRLRLLLTARARLQGGHGDAAARAWKTLTHATGRPELAWLAELAWLDRAIQKWLAHCAARGRAGMAPAQQSLTPL